MAVCQQMHGYSCVFLYVKRDEVTCSRENVCQCSLGVGLIQGSATALEALLSKETLVTYIATCNCHVQSFGKRANDLFEYGTAPTFPALAISHGALVTKFEPEQPLRHDK